MDELSTMAYLSISLFLQPVITKSNDTASISNTFIILYFGLYTFTFSIQYHAIFVIVLAKIRVISYCLDATV